MNTRSTVESSDVRRITPADEAYLRRFRAEMKFTHAGPFPPLEPLAPLKPARGPSGVVLRKQPRYTPTSPESYTIGSRLGEEIVALLAAVFGREDRSSGRRRGRGKP